MCGTRTYLKKQGNSEHCTKPAIGEKSLSKYDNCYSICYIKTDKPQGQVILRKIVLGNVITRVISC